jgi:hypothetical protein
MGKNKRVDTITLTLFVLRNNRYSAIDKLVYIGYNLLLVSVALSIIGLIFLSLGGAAPDQGIGPQELSQAYSTYYGILLVGLPIVLISRKIMEPRYKGAYFALKNQERKK